MTESEFQQTVTDLCDWQRVRWHHEVDSRRSKRGFPDLVLVGKRVIFVELKKQTGRVSREQQEWLDSLEAAGQEAYVWRPSDLPQITKILREIALR